MTEHTNKHVALEHARDTFINSEGLKGVTLSDQPTFFAYVKKIESYLNGEEIK